jgi:hypothetical protein
LTVSGIYLRAASIQPSIRVDIFYDESPNDYSFINEDLGLPLDEYDFDTNDFYYNEEELSTPPKMDDNTISNLQSPTLWRWGSFLQDGPTKCEVDMSTIYPNPELVLKNDKGKTWTCNKILELWDFANEKSHNVELKQGITEDT